MAELPYMQFFPSDWMGDCQILTLAARGGWQTIICKAWHPSTRGVVSLKLSAWARLFGATVEQTEKVIAEIEETNIADVAREGEIVTITCRRIVRDWQRRVDEKEALSDAGKRGAAKRWGGHSHPNGPPIDGPLAIQNPEATKHEREPAREFPAWESVQAMAASIGLAEWKARDWFDEMEGCGWIDYQKRPIHRWQSVLARVKTKWEADGRPEALRTASPGAPRAGRQEAARPRVVSQWAHKIKPHDQ